ncbi:STAS domain-containing protein [Actinosynnema sp. NPDC059797]
MSENPASAAASVQADTVEGVPVVHVADEIDMSSVEAVRVEVLIWLDGLPERVGVVDLSGVTFLGSSGLALLVEAARNADRCGIRFVLVAGHRAVLRSIQATQLDEDFDFHTVLKG